MSVFLVFWALVIAVVAGRARRERLLEKSPAEWVLDGSGLFVQGVLIPLVEIAVLFRVWEQLFPSWRGAVSVPGATAFLLNFAGVDYLYYWNHRLLHRPGLWPIHAVHHTVTEMDVLGTSRNTLWSSFLIVYVWVNSIALYLLEDPTWFAAGAAATACLDLWRHSPFGPRRLPLLITSQDHAWHHASGSDLGNFGANLKVWDRLHGTWRESSSPPTVLGVGFDVGLVRKLLWPFS